MTKKLIEPNFPKEEDKHSEYITKRGKFWLVLKEIRKEFVKEVSDNFDPYEFERYVKDKYGIQLNFVEGNIGGTYEVVDEHKHLIFLLKF